MTSDDAASCLFFTFVCCFVTLVLSALFFSSMSAKNIHEIEAEAVKRGYATYEVDEDRNVEFIWKEN